MIQRKSTIFLLATLLILAACSDDDDTAATAQSYPVVITAQGFSLDEDSEGTTYTNGETLGVYMLEGGTDNIVPPYSNLRYYANRYDDQDYFLPGNNDSIPYFPATGEQRDIAAYYPRTVTLADSLVNIHLTEHYDYASSLLWARVNGLDKDNRTAFLQLRPALTLLTFNLRAGYGVTVDELAGTVITLRGLPVSGYFNALNGHTSYNEGITQDIVVTEDGIATQSASAAVRTAATRANDSDSDEQQTVTMQVFVLPSSTTQGYTMTVEIPSLGQTYEQDIPAAGASDFAGSTEYEFDTQINDDDMIVSVQSSPINNWGQSGSISGEGEETTE